MNIITELQIKAQEALRSVFDHEVDASQIIVNVTKKDFTGEYTIVTFPFTKPLKSNPVQIGNQLGEWLKENSEDIVDFNCIQGFLNLSMAPAFWMQQLQNLISTPDYWRKEATGKKIMVEFSSPNTNKPLHLGHIRNILLGWSCGKLYEAIGYDVIKTQIVNDRGIAINKSMLAWKKYADGQTPESAGQKSDHFVGEWYVRFEQEFQKEYAIWQETTESEEIYQDQMKEEESRDVFFKRYKNQYFNQYSNLGREAKDMLLKWEAGDEEVRGLWQKMNNWVYEGFEQTYQDLGVHFDKLYYESETYLLGKDLIEKGLESDQFYQKEDGSIWVDLEKEGMDQKILLRADGTSVYMTQDLGTAELRYQDYGADRMVYVVGDEQNYHFKALFNIMKKLDAPYADGLYHLSYGMIDLPTGKMKSREGTVVDADDLIADVVKEARAGIEEKGELVDVSEEGQEKIIDQIALAALKFFMIKIDPQKRMVFDPKASVDLHGQTGPYIQNAYVRIQSILRKAGEGLEEKDYTSYEIVEAEKLLLQELLSFGSLVEQAAEQYDPSSIANFCYQLAKDFHRYYHDYRILKAESEEAKYFRIAFIKMIAHIMASGMDLLGIEMPERM